MNNCCDRDRIHIFPSATISELNELAAMRISEDNANRSCACADKSCACADAAAQSEKNASQYADDAAAAVQAAKDAKASAADAEDSKEKSCACADHSCQCADDAATSAASAKQFAEEALANAGSNAGLGSNSSNIMLAHALDTLTLGQANLIACNYDPFFLAVTAGAQAPSPFPTGAYHSTNIKILNAATIKKVVFGLIYPDHAADFHVAIYKNSNLVGVLDPSYNPFAWIGSVQMVSLPLQSPIQVDAGDILTVVLWSLTNTGGMLAEIPQPPDAPGGYSLRILYGESFQFGYGDPSYSPNITASPPAAQPFLQIGGMTGVNARWFWVASRKGQRSVRL